MVELLQEINSVALNCRTDTCLSQRKWRPS